MLSSLAMPALLTRRWIPFDSFWDTSSARRFTSSLLLMSPGRATIFPGPVLYCSTTLLKASSRLPVMYTFAPLETRACVIINPIPVPPPVTTALNLETSKSLEALSSSFERADVLSEDIGLVMVKVDGFRRLRRTRLVAGLWSSLSIVSPSHRSC